jgi:hypothetical protein
MRVSHGRLSAALVVIVGILGCRSGAAGGSSKDSAAPPTSATGAGASTLARSDSIILRTDKTQYRAGEPVALTFENRSAATYTFNACTRTIEHESNGTWTALPDEGRMCTMQAFLLAPHATQTGSTELPTPLPAGRYRIAVRMTLDQATGQPANPVYAISEPITVP